ncbi:MAG: hypothetical protein H6731_11020 [Myxococcales bacterium]|nr:MAG: hypothetical protein H6731_11020 [Myxococcales bacterium]
MQKIIALLVCTLCSGVFAKSIVIEIWDIGNGSSRPLIDAVKMEASMYVQNSTIVQTHEYSPKHPVCGGAYKVCYDVAENAEFNSVLEKFNTIAETAKALDSCPMSDKLWLHH